MSLTAPRERRGRGGAQRPALPALGGATELLPARCARAMSTSHVRMIEDHPDMGSARAGSWTGEVPAPREPRVDLRSCATERVRVDVKERERLRERFVRRRVAVVGGRRLARERAE